MSVIDTGSIPSNSHKSKEKKKERLNPVVKQDGVVSTKKSVGKKLRDTFINDDLGDIKDYVFFDVVVPTLKDTAMNILEMIFYGQTTGRSLGYRRGGDPYPYNRSYKTSTLSPRDRGGYRDRKRYSESSDVDYQNIVLRTRPDAEEVVRQMHLRIREFGMASIADLYDLVRIPGNYNDNDWGWVDERDIGVRRVGNGYLIQVSKPVYLD